MPSIADFNGYTHGGVVWEKGMELGWGDKPDDEMEGRIAITKRATGEGTIQSPKVSLHCILLYLQNLSYRATFNMVHR